LNLILDSSVGLQALNPEVSSINAVIEGVDYEDVIAKYPKTNRIGILTARLRAKGRDEYWRVEGSKGAIIVSGLGASLPRRQGLRLTGRKRGRWCMSMRGWGFILRLMQWQKIFSLGRKRMR
jgi:dihydrodiol dehydrogenase / D-xylose 1-dehydrogenase (NADP)